MLSLKQSECLSPTSEIIDFFPAETFNNIKFHYFFTAMPTEVQNNHPLTKLYQNAMQKQTSSTF